MTVFCSTHPVVKHHVTALRDAAVPPAVFRSHVDIVSHVLAMEASARLALVPRSVQTPLTRAEGQALACLEGSGEGPVIVPVLRAGLGLMAGFEHLFPVRSVGHIVIQRDEVTKLPAVGLVKLPPLAGRPVFLLDPMLATAGSALAAMDCLVAHGASPELLCFVCLIAAPEGIAKLEARYPDVPIVAGAIDERLNEHAYIVPGLGDAGDRLYGTGHGHG